MPGITTVNLFRWTYLLTWCTHTHTHMHSQQWCFNCSLHEHLTKWHHLFLKSDVIDCFTWMGERCCHYESVHALSAVQCIVYCILCEDKLMIGCVLCFIEQGGGWKYCIMQQWCFACWLLDIINIYWVVHSCVLLLSVYSRCTLCGCWCVCETRGSHLESHACTAALFSVSCD